jgi:sulfur dioxygenase
MIFRQLYDATSSTYTYLLADEHSREALLIDPVFEQAQRDLALIDELELNLKLVADTHCHADHITAAWPLKQRTGCLIASAAVIGAEHVDVPLYPRQRFGVSGIELEARATPGHTDGCMSFVLADQSMVFTGDALLIRGCGRSDFQQGNARTLYRSITEQLFTLPDACAVYPAHDYHGRTQSTIGEEKRFNARIGGGANETDFVGYMEAMRLPHPKLIDEAVPANLRSGAPEDGQLHDEADWADLRITFAGVPEVEPAWLIHNQPSVTVLDVRHDDEIVAGESPPGLRSALRIPLDELRARIDEVPGDKPVVALCRSGRRSAMAVTILKEHGFEKVASLRGGLMKF